MSPYLDITISLPSCTSLALSLAHGSTGHDMYERCRVLSHACTSLATVFRNAQRLRYAEIPLTGVTSTLQMFDTCSNLIEAVLPGTMTAITNAGSMFTQCNALRTVTGTFNLQSCTTVSTMFNLCSNLIVPPLTNTGAVLDWSNAFIGCNQLTSITLDTTAATTVASMFSSCIRLTTVNLSSTANVTNTSNMFNACSSLKTGPTMNTAAVTNAATMFQSCVSLTDVPAYDLRACTNITSMFAGCTALRIVGAIQFSGALVTTTNLFQLGNTALEQFRATGITRGFALPNPNQLTGTELNTVYTNLGTAFGAQTITVTGSFGTATDNPAIATAKGWTVTGS